MLATGLNGFINAQGFPRTGMMTTLIGAVLNLLLDPLFIFVFHMGGRWGGTCNNYKSGRIGSMGSEIPYKQKRKGCISYKTVLP